ncbi:efflux RND transporter periplasmic adaptor subunit [Gemmatimonadota bacterium]
MNRIPYVLSAAALGLLLVLAGCGRPAETAEDTYVRMVNVETTEVVLRPFTSNTRITATVEAFNDVTVVAEEGGVVDDILVEKGSRVRRGQVLARLNSDVLQSQVEESRAAAELAEDQWQRQKRLWEDEQIGTEQAYIQARANARMRQAMLRTLETRLAKKVIESPVDGNFDDYYVEEGEYAVPGAPFARVISTNRMKIVGGLPERYATEVTVGTPAEILLDPYPDRVFQGRIDFVGGAVDTQSRVITVEVHLDNPGGILKAGMLAHLRLIRHSYDEAIVVPQESVLRSELGYQVYVAVEEEGRMVARARTVEVGPGQNDMVVITSGLEPGDRLVTLGQLKLGDGDILNVVSDEGMPGEDSDGEDGSV